jgi:hypothetical protein
MIRSGFSLILVLNFVFMANTFAQDHDQTKEQNHKTEDHDQVHKKHIISASLNHTVIFSAIKNDENKTNIILPSFGINYTFAFNHKWGVGLHSDIIIEDFVVKGDETRLERSGTEVNNTAIIERGTPISAALMVIYKPIPYLGLMAGAGREFSSHQDFTVIRFGLEAPFHLPHNWELFGVLTYDINIDAYKSLTYGIGIGKMF